VAPVLRDRSRRTAPDSSSPPKRINNVMRVTNLQSVIREKTEERTGTLLLHCNFLTRLVRGFCCK
jgi:hypothetical protein